MNHEWNAGLQECRNAAVDCGMSLIHFFWFQLVPGGEMPDT